MSKFKFTESLDVELFEQDAAVDIAESKTGSQRTVTRLVEAIHSVLTKNKTFYPEEELQKATESWTSPHPKPILKNHNWYSGDPLGRVKKAEFVPSQKLLGTKCIKLTLGISDQDAIERVIDGRYLTVSIGASASKVTCSICGINLVEAGMCMHRRGKIYDTKECFWILADLNFEEISFVNIPADPHAQVIATDTTEGGDNNMEESVIDLSDLDALLSAPKHESTSGLPVEESLSPEQKTDQTQASIAEDFQKRFDEQCAKIEELEQTNSALTKENKQLSEQLGAVQKETTEMHAQNVRIATSAHKLMAEHIVNLEIVLGEIKPEEKQTKMDELVRQKASALKSKADELVTKRAKRQMLTITSPGAAIPGAGDVAEDKKDLSVPKTKTLADLAEMATSVLTRKQ